MLRPTLLVAALAVAFPAYADADLDALRAEIKQMKTDYEARIHVPLGQWVLARGIIFLDLAVAQLAVLGVIVAHTLGWETQGWHPTGRDQCRVDRRGAA